MNFIGILEKILKNFWTIFAALVIGVVIGIYTPNMAEIIYPFGQVYFGLLFMCCLIILPVLIIGSIGRIVLSQHSSMFISKVFIALVLTCVLVAGLSIAISFLLSPITKPDFYQVQNMGKLTIQKALTQDKEESSKLDILKNFYFIHSINTDNKLEKKQKRLLEVMLDFFPNNIFDAFAKNDIIKILVFSIIVGFLLRCTPPDIGKKLIEFCDNTFNLFSVMLSFFLYLLPFGLVVMISNQCKCLSFGVIKPFIGLGVLLSVVTLTFFIVGIIVILYTSRKSFMTVLKALKEPMLLSFAANNNIVAIPSLVRGMSEDLDLNRNKVSMTVPIWLTMEFHTAILLFAVGSCFVIQMYEIKISVIVILTVLIGSIAAGIATVSYPPDVWVVLIAIVLDPLDIPSSAIIFALFIFEPFLNGIHYMLNVVISCAASSVLSMGNQNIAKNQQYS